MAHEDLPAITIDDRRLKIEERKLGIEEMRIDIEMRALRSPQEQAFELEQRLATALAKSPFLPDNVGKDMGGRIAAGIGILRYAAMLGADPFVVAQNIYVVHGRIGFSSAFLIAVVNARAGLQRAIDWTVTGAGETLSVTCSAVDAHGTERVVTMEMAQVKVWGWAAKSDPWKADPALMLRYRTAAKLIRLYLGGAVMGLTTTVEELRDVTPEAAQVSGAPAARVFGGAPSPRLLASNLHIEEVASAEVVPAEVVPAEVVPVGGEVDPFVALGLTREAAEQYTVAQFGRFDLTMALNGLSKAGGWRAGFDASPWARR